MLLKCDWDETLSYIVVCKKYVRNGPHRPQCEWHLCKTIRKEKLLTNAAITVAEYYEVRSQEYRNYKSLKTA